MILGRPLIDSKFPPSPWAPEFGLSRPVFDDFEIGMSEIEKLYAIAFEEKIKKIINATNLFIADTEIPITS